MGLLDSKTQKELELHLLECPQCLEKVKQFNNEAHLLKLDPEVRKEVSELAEYNENFERSTKVAKDSTFSFKRFLPTYIPSAVAIAAILFILLVKPWQVTIEPNLEAIAAQNSMVVLYFDDLTEDDKISRLGEIATNLLITDLSESEYINVLSIQRFNDILRHLGIEERSSIDDETAGKIAAEAGASWMLKGSILQTSPKLIITSQLIDINSGKVEESKQIKGSPNEDIFSLIDRLVVEIKADMSLPKSVWNEPDRSVADITTHSTEAYGHYLEGINLNSRFYFREAEESFRKALELDSTFAMAYYYLAGLVTNTERIPLIENAVKYSENSSLKDKYYIKSRMANYSGDIEKAAAALEQLINRYPEEKLAYYRLAVFAGYLNKIGKKLIYLNRAIEIDPWYKEAINMLAYHYSDIGSINEAMETLDKYIEIAPDEPNPYDSRGEIYARAKILDSAITYFNEALKRKNDFNNSLFYLARIYSGLGKENKAREYLKSLEKSSTIMFHRIGHLGPAYLSLYKGKFKEALAFLDSLIVNKTGDTNNQLNLIVIARAYLLKSKIECELKNYDKALSEFETYTEYLEKVYPGRMLAFSYYHAELLAKSGRLDEAMDAAENLKEQIEKTNQNLNRYWYVMGIIAFEKNDYKNAEKYFQWANDGVSYDAAYMLGLTYLKAGMYVPFINVFQILDRDNLRKKDFDPILETKLHFYLATAYEKVHSTGSAIKGYTYFLENWKDNDSDIEEVKEAKSRLSKLKSKN
jgi:tetratricopeptide (TPR) repeat protein